MTEKEKAKAYNEALERAKKLYGKGITEEIFPELNESEDERIRKEIISILRNAYWTSNKNRFNELVAWLEKQGKEEYVLKSFKDEDVRKFMQYIEKQAKAYEFNLPNRSYDIYAFAKDLLVWLEKQSEQESSQINERVWLYLISDVLTLKDGIGQYLDDPRVQELAKRLCKEYAQKLYNPSNTGKNEQKSADKIEPRFKVGDWVVNKFGDSWYIDSLDNKNYQVSDGKGNYNYFPISKQDEMHLWTIQDAKDGDVLCRESSWMCIFKALNNHTNTFSSYCFMDSDKCFFNIGIDGHTLDKNFIKAYNGEIYPATKEQCDIFFQKMKEAGYKWNADTKTLEKLVKHKFDPKTLKPFDKVLVKCSSIYNSNLVWRVGLFSYFYVDDNSIRIYTLGSDDNNPNLYVIPYNDDTKHLVNTTEEAPEYYRYWGD